ncbi:MAG: 4Fe-4S binding protein [Deltaproteobacteria bacterium]|nr:4Fe-4S binding protein [Deltaproteobacteria bacterium]
MTTNIAAAGTDNVITKQKTKLTWIRRLSQTAALFVIGEFSFYGIFRCPFAVPYVSCANCPVIQCPGRWMVYPFWLALGVSTILFGRSFCGWACPGGFVSGLLSNLSTIRGKLKGGLNRKLHLLKYPTLAASLMIWFWMSNPRWAIPIRTGEFWGSVTLTFQHANNLWLIRTFCVLALILLGGVAGNLWCRYLCPTGGALEGVRRFGLFQYRKSSECNQCGLCSEVCEMGTQPESYNCTNCGDCTSSCPSNAIYFGRAGERTSYMADRN